MKMSEARMKTRHPFIIFFVTLVSTLCWAQSLRGQHFDRIIFVVFENTDYTTALQQPFFHYLSQKGVLFSDMSALAHPSQGNYIALTSGDLNGVKDDSTYDVNASNIIDLIEKRGLSWKVYAENYPGHCFSGSASHGYVRKHNPFISYLDIQKSPTRCLNIVNADQFSIDAKNGRLTQYIFYVPNIKNDGHDTGASYADSWYRNQFGPYLADSQFMNNTVLVSTFDESKSHFGNHIYTSIVGSNIKPGVYSRHLNIISLLKMVEDNWQLGSLGRQDLSAPSIDSIWIH